MHTGRSTMFFAPVIYEHAAALIVKSPWEVSRDAALMFAAHAQAYRRYHHSPVVIGIDIYNLEPEAYGAVVEKPDGNGIPAITHPVFHSLAEISAVPHFDPTLPPDISRIGMVLDAALQLQKYHPDADVRVPVSGPFSIAGNLIGFENLLMESITDPESLTRALFHLVDGQVRFIAEIQNRNLDVSLFESGASPPLVSPGLFASAILPPLTDLMKRSEEILGHPVPCIIGGDTALIIDSILETGTKYVICPAETDQSGFMEKIRDRTDITVRVNMTPSIIAHGNPDEIHAEVDRILALINGRENACIGTGPLPFETPPANVLDIEKYLGSMGFLQNNFRNPA